MLTHVKCQPKINNYYELPYSSIQWVCDYIEMHPFNEYPFGEIDNKYPFVEIDNEHLFVEIDFLIPLSIRSNRHLLSSMFSKNTLPSKLDGQDLDM